ncbi:TonB-dependent receptor, partial [Salmonella enterica subsp. enterica]
SASGPLDPTLSEQYEVGVKYEPKGWNTLISASVYDLRKKDDSLYDNGDYRNVGRSRAKGVELELNSDITENINVTAAYTYTDSRV